MTDNNAENFSESEFEDRGDVVWNEFDWQHYILEQHKTVAQFKDLYIKIRNGQITWADLRNEMGWTENTVETPEGEAEFTGNLFEASQWSSDNEFDSEFDSSDEPFTVHKQPLYIATVGIFHYIQDTWENFLLQEPGKISGISSWIFARCIKESQFHALFAVNALEAGEFTLAISHLKFGVSAINNTFYTLNQYTAYQDSFSLQLIRAALFDLREIYLKVIQDCRYADSNLDDSPGE